VISQIGSGIVNRLTAGRWFDKALSVRAIVMKGSRRMAINVERLIAKHFPLEHRISKNGHILKSCNVAAWLIGNANFRFHM
jgi:hypothetical protein